MEYLIPGDAWGIFRFANSLNDFSEMHDYPYFWSYTSFGFSILSGIPLININVLLAPFCYLFVMTQYFFFKAILIKFNDKYVILSTILVSIFSGFYFWSNLNPLNDLNLFGELYFNYKGVALYFIFFAISIFIIDLRNNSNLNIYGILVNRKFKLITVSVIFFMISYMTHMIPLLIGLVFILIYILFSDKNEYKYSSVKAITLLTFLIIIFFIYDCISNFNQSYLFYRFFGNLLKNFINISILSGLIRYSAYIFLFGTLIFGYIIILIRNKVNLGRILINQNFLYYIFYLIFLIFLSFFTAFIFLNIFNLNKSNWIFYYIDLIFGSIGIIGVIGISLSYYCFKKDRYLYKILVVNILFSIFYASIIFIRTYGFYILPSIFPEDFSQKNVDFSFYWFSRNWIYAIPSFVILTSIGLIELTKGFKRRIYFKLRYQKMKILFNFAFIVCIVTLLTSNFIVGGLYWGNKERQIKDSEIEFFSWMSEKHSEDSVVLTEIYLYQTIRYYGNGEIPLYFYNFEKNNNGSLSLNDFRNEIIPFLKDNNVAYFIHYDYDFINDNKDEIRISRIYEYLTLEILYNIENYLIPQFYNQTIYKNKDLTLYYAPYFNSTYKN